MADGIRDCNKIGRKVEPLIDIQKLKTNYLFGINIEDDEGNPLPDSVFQSYIDNAVSMLEHELDISITPKIGEIEDHDYRFNDYMDWGYLTLNNYPVIEIQKIEMVYYYDNTGTPETVQDIPAAWIRLQRHDGIVRLIPNARFPANLQIGASGSFFPEVLRGDLIPHLWRVTYDHGFEDGKIPSAINHAIGMLAAVQAFIVGGGLVIGAGIASESISLDGLSQTINTTQSAENHAYSAQMNNYNDLLFGKNEKDKGLIGMLKVYYKGETLAII